jgi:hypothetical protein
MDRCEVLKVDGVLDELEDVHLYEPGIMLSPPNETAVIDLRKAFYVVRRLRRRAFTYVSVLVIDEHPAMKLLHRPGPRAMSGVCLALVGLTDDAAVSADPPAVEWALDAIALHRSVGQIGAEMGTIGVNCVRLPRGIAKHHPLVSRALHERRTIAKIDRPTDDVPAFGIRRRIGGLAYRLDDGIEIPSLAKSAR